MEKENSASAQFGFNKPAQDNKQNETTTAKETNVSKAVVENELNDEKSKDNLEEKYFDQRTVSVALVKNYSLYRRVNDKVLPKRRDFIGSCINSSRILSSNKEEVETYFPNIVGVAPNNDRFITRVKQYLNNISIPVDELGVTFDISFHYNHKKDYYKILEEEERIEKEYSLVNKQDTLNLKKALKNKIARLNALESTKCTLGYPENVEDYLMYRHCLLYNSVAKDIALINSDPSIRFYFKDDKKEAEKAKKYRLEINKAKANYVTTIGDDRLFDAIYIQYCLLNNLPILSSLAEDRLNREIKLDRFSTEEPVKFNKLFINKDIKLMATIELLIARGELIRSQYNQNITTSDGTFIGANIGEAVAWFKNPENISIVNAYKSKLNNI